MTDFLLTQLLVKSALHRDWTEKRLESMSLKFAPQILELFLCRRMERFDLLFSPMLETSIPNIKHSDPNASGKRTS